MNSLVIASMFRKSSGYIAQYFKQIDALCERPEMDKYNVRLILAEGDSVDDTWDKLQAYSYRRANVDLFQCNHGGRELFGVDSIEHWTQIATVDNAILDRVKESDDIVIYVESDLLWEPDLMLALLAHLENVPAVAPLCVWDDDRKTLRDWWGYSKDGTKFGEHAPYHDGINETGLTQIDTAGSCIVMRAEIARKARFTNEEGMVGFGHSIYQNGYTLWLDPKLAVRHPRFK